MKTAVPVFFLFFSLFSCAGLEKDRSPLIPESTRGFEEKKARSETMADTHTMRYEEFENGFRLLLIEMPESPVCVGTVGFAVGGRYEPERRSGISHLLEHLLFRSSSDNSAVNAIRRMGGSVNALTDYELTYYHFTVLPKYFEDSLSALIGMVLDPDFDGNDLKKEREVVLEELARGKNDPRTLALSSLVKRVFPSSPLKNLVIGTRQSVQSISLDDLYRFHDAYYTPSNMIVVCAGRLDVEKTARYLRARFETAARSPVPSVLFGPPILAEHELSRMIPANQAFYIRGALSPGRGDRDFYPMEVLDLVLGSGNNSRLQRRITAQEGITEEIFTFRHTLSDTGIWTVMCSTDPADFERAKRLVTEEIELVRDGDLTQREVDDAKRALAARELIRLDSPKELCVFELENIVFRSEVIPVEAHLERIGDIERQQVLEAARTYLSSENSVSVSLLPAPAAHRPFLLLKIAVTGEI
ncbi:MAG: insulinase family protein [Spirochaetes bacterium]|nr:insulinase family protein [Spirochaetota bacterium]